MSKPGHSRPVPIGALIGDVVQPTMAARGLSEGSLIAHWREIVGERIAAFAEVEAVQWPPRGDKRDPFGPSAPATLVLRIDGAFALEAGHMAMTIVGRVNAHLGWRCVDRIAFRQGPLTPPPPKRVRKAPPSAEALARARELGAGIEDQPLRDALARLGARIIDKARGEG
ncbi:MAG: DUF721 domain-containing protein [Roseiarcus sp.]